MCEYMILHVWQYEKLFDNSIAICIVYMQGIKLYIKSHLTPQENHRPHMTH